MHHFSNGRLAGLHRRIGCSFVFGLYLFAGSGSSGCRLVLGLSRLARFLFFRFALVDGLAVSSDFLFLALPFGLRRWCGSVWCGRVCLGPAVGWVCEVGGRKCGICRGRSYTSSKNIRIVWVRTRDADGIRCESNILRGRGRRRDGRGTVLRRGVVDLHSVSEARRHGHRRVVHEWWNQENGIAVCPENA